MGAPGTLQEPVLKLPTQPGPGGGCLLVHGSKYIVFFVYFVHRREMAYLYFLHLLAKRAQLCLRSLDRRFLSSLHEESATSCRNFNKPSICEAAVANLLLARSPQTFARWKFKIFIRCVTVFPDCNASPRTCSLIMTGHTIISKHFSKNIYLFSSICLAKFSV